MSRTTEARSARPVGIGFSGQGLFERSHYRRLPASYRPEAAWVFEGIDEKILGDFGLSGGGAAGFEFDRTYRDLGTPENFLVLARSEGHGPSFIPAHEELLTHISTVSGEPTDALMRTEIVYFDNPAGGAVFAVGSITFCGSSKPRQSPGGNRLTLPRWEAPSMPEHRQKGARKCFATVCRT